MNESILKEIAKLDFDISIRQEKKQTFYKQIYNEYANFNLDVTFWFSDDLEQVIDITIDTFEAFTCGGDEFETYEITDDEIKENINY